MASYTAASGKRIAGGRDIYPDATLDLIDAAASGGWVKLNANLFSDAWPPSGLQTPLTPQRIITPWSSFAWDTKRHGLWLWGGGHANYSGNDVYFWSAVTRQWSLAFHTSTVARGTSAAASDGDGVIFAASDNPHSPLSSHTYDSNVYLPILDRFVTFGGAGQGLALAFGVFENEQRLRFLAGYKLQLGLAGQGYLGGLAGFNYQGSGYENVQLPGARAWEPIDWYLDNPTMPTTLRNKLNCGCAYEMQGGKDTVFLTISGISSRAMFHAVFEDQDYRNDVITRVSGATGFNGGGQGTLALDKDKRVLVEVLDTDTTAKFQFIDLKRTWGTGNEWYSVESFSGDSGVVADFIASRTTRSGMDYDPVRQELVIWEKGPKVWALQVPTGDPTPTTGWTVYRRDNGTGDAPVDSWPLSQSGTHGKWKYAPDLDAFVGLIHPENGDVWAWKPSGWLDPRL